MNLYTSEVYCYTGKEPLTPLEVLNHVIINSIASCGDNEAPQDYLSVITLANV